MDATLSVDLISSQKCGARGTNQERKKWAIRYLRTFQINFEDVADHCLVNDLR